MTPFRYRLATLFAGLLLGSLALGAGHNQLKEKPMAKDQALSAEIDAVLDEYEAMWDLQDPARLIEMWDTSDDQPFYLAEEQDDWRIGWDQVKNYWDPPGKSSTEALRMRFDGTQARWLTDDLVYATFWIRFDTKMIFMPKPISTDARGSAILRKTDDGWKFLTWQESPLSPILYVQKLYEMRLRPDFPEYMEEAKQRKREAERRASARD